jgi:BNR/Asp-box repeat
VTNQRTDLIAIGTRKGLWLARSDDDRRSWTLDGPHLLAQEVAAVGIDTRGPRPRVLAGTQYGHWGPTVMWSDDLGGTWEETEQGAIRFPEDTGAALARVWQLRPDSPERPDVVWAGCEPHSLWRSTDGGRTFELVRGLWDHPHRPTWEPGGGGAAIHTILPDAATDRVVIAMSAGGVYVSDDGGASWEPRNRGIAAGFLPEEPEYGQCVHKVAIDAGDPHRMYAQNHGGVFRTDDGGRKWTSIAEDLPADFGFPIVASPRTPGTAWVIPLVADMQRVPPDGRLRVYRTEDAGESWAQSSSGLPDGSWTSVLRDAFCADEGDPIGLYFGTRDGCVYASADDGQTFTLVADHLPDVLSVRAARLP